MFDSVDAVLCMKNGLEESENWRSKLPHSYYCYGGALSISEYSSFKFDNLSVDANDEPFVRPYFNKIDEHVFSCQGRAYGLWRLIRHIDDLINYKVAYIDFLDFIPCLPPEGNQAAQLMMEIVEVYDDIDEPNEDVSDVDYEDESNSHRITDRDLWITAFDIRRLLNCNEDYHLLDTLKNINQLSNNENKLQPVHPVVNRHAANREQVLIAAIKFKEEQPNVFKENCIKPDGSINYSGFAREILERPLLFGNAAPPMKTTDAIIKVLKKAFTSNAK